MNSFFYIHTEDRITRCVIVRFQTGTVFKWGITLVMGTSGNGFDRFTFAKMMLFEQLIHHGDTHRNARISQQGRNLLAGQMGPLYGFIHRRTCRMLGQDAEKDGIKIRDRLKC